MQDILPAAKIPAKSCCESGHASGKRDIHTTMQWEVAALRDGRWCGCGRGSGGSGALNLLTAI